MKKAIWFRSVTLLAVVVAVVACGLASPSSGGDAVEDKMGYSVRRAYDSHVERKARGVDVESPMLVRIRTFKMSYMSDLEEFLEENGVEVLGRSRDIGITKTGRVTAYVGMELIGAIVDMQFVKRVVSAEGNEYEVLTLMWSEALNLFPDCWAPSSGHGRDGCIPEVRRHKRAEMMRKYERYVDWRKSWERSGRQVELRRVDIRVDTMTPQAVDDVADFLEDYEDGGRVYRYKDDPDHHRWGGSGSRHCVERPRWVVGGCGRHRRREDSRGD